MSVVGADVDELSLAQQAATNKTRGEAAG
ncbi:uncharacterized protein METZ01_LOCUS82358 [marine metagenome]|uniref:Uncharacterized protein n=1 Tax=marine metagenome TaxID=408172 RepID=A0A381UNF4_9ZZZZ